MEALRDDLDPKGQWNPEYRNDLAGVYMNRGVANEGLPDLPGAVADYGNAITIMEGLRDNLEPKGQWNPGYRNDLALAYANLALCLVASDSEQAIAHSTQAIQLYETLAIQYPILTWPASFRRSYRFALNIRAAAYRALGKDNLADADERRAREIPD